MNITKITFLFIAIIMTLSYAGKLAYKEDIPLVNLVWQTIGIVGFVTMQFNLL